MEEVVGSIPTRSTNKISLVMRYGPVPPLWQSLQFTWVRSPRSTGC